MFRSMNRFSIIISAALVLLVSPLVSAQSVPLSDAQLNAVLANCAVAQVSLGRIQQSDKPVRINRGFRYDSLLKLMVKFNTRAVQNRIDAPELVSITSSYEKEIKSFTQTYTDYDDMLTTIQKMACREIPTDFYDLLVKVREKRFQLENNVVQIDQYLDEYQSAVDKVRGLVLGSANGEELND